MHHAHLAPTYPVNYATSIRRIMPFYDDMVQGVAATLTRHSRVWTRAVELGCGNGEMSECLFDSGARVVVGVDYSESVLQYVRGRFAERLDSTFLTIKGDICSPDTWAHPELQEPVDLVVASLIFHDLDTTAQRSRLLANVARILRPGGIFCFADPLDDGRDLDRHLDQWTRCMALQPGEVSSLRDDDPQMFSPLSHEALRRLAGQAGLVHEGRNWSHLHFSVEIFRKRPAKGS
jgi:SAM-dependent methyltransferase